MTRLKEQLEKSGISQAELAKRINRKMSTVSLAVKLGIKTCSAAKRYARVLNCNPLDLIEL